MVEPKDSTALVLFSKTASSRIAKTRLRKSRLEETKVQLLQAAFVGGTLNLVHGSPIKRKYAFWYDSPGLVDLTSLVGSFPSLAHYEQRGASFGERFSNMLDHLAQEGIENCIVIGSDCPFLDVATLEDARKAIRAGHNCFGPAQRGGLYLLGLTSLPIDICWESFFSHENQHSAFLNLFPDNVRLKMLHDVDTREDLLVLRERKHQLQPETRSLLQREISF